MNSGALSLLGVGAAFLIIGCAASSDGTTTSTNPTSPVDGATLYAQNCKSCHGDKAQGVVGVGPNMAKILSDEKDAFTNEAFTLLLRKGVDPEGESICAVMPKYPATSISDEGAIALRTYILSLPVSSVEAALPGSCGD